MSSGQFAQSVSAEIKPLPSIFSFTYRHCTTLHLKVLSNKTKAGRNWHQSIGTVLLLCWGSGHFFKS
jgi:hypothetical protein